MLIETARGRIAISGDCVYSRMQLTGRNNDGVYMPLNNATGSVWEQLKTIDKLNDSIAGDLTSWSFCTNRAVEGLPVVKDVDGFRIVEVSRA